MRKLYLIALVSGTLVVAHSNVCSAQNKDKTKTTDKLIRRLLQAQKKGKTVQVTLKDGTIEWGQPVDVSTTAFTLSSTGWRNTKPLRYDQLESVRYEGGWTKFVGVIRHIVTGPVVIVVFTIWSIQGHRC